MLYEMRTYSFLPTDLPKYLKHAEEVGRLVRGNDYGANLGCWTSEFGHLNQVWHLWRYDSYAQREELRADSLRTRLDEEIRCGDQGLGETPRYSYLEHAYGLSRRRRGTFTSIVTTAFSLVGSGPGLRCLRKRYRIAKILQTRRSLAHGSRTAERSLSSLDISRLQRAGWGPRGSSQDEAWRAFLKVSGTYLVEMNNVLLMPTNYSPAK